MIQMGRRQDENKLVVHVCPWGSSSLYQQIRGLICAIPDGQFGNTVCLLCRLNRALLGDSAGRGPWAAETHGQHRGRQFASVLGAARRLEQEAADRIALEFWHRGLESGYQCYLDFSQRSVRRMHHFGSMGKICFKAPQQGDWVLCAGWQVRGGGWLDLLGRLSARLWGVGSVKAEKLTDVRPRKTDSTWNSAPKSRAPQSH